MNLKFRNIFSVCMMLFAGTVSAQTIFVSTKGNDHWAGTNRRPVATIEPLSIRGRESCYSRPRIVLPSAASSVTFGRESTTCQAFQEVRDRRVAILEYEPLSWAAPANQNSARIFSGF